MIYIILALSLLTACAPTTSTLKTEDSVRINAFDNLVANKWCQQNQSTRAAEFSWQFSKDFKATSVDLSSQQQESFGWSITDDNVLTVTDTTNTVLFNKKIYFNYSVAEHKQAMQWTDLTPEVIHFIECD